MDDEDELDPMVEVDIIDHDNINEGVERLIDVVSNFKSTSTMGELDDDALVEMANALQSTLYTVIGIIYSRGQVFNEDDCDHDEDEDDE